MAEEQKQTSQPAAQTSPGGRALANAICILTLLFVLGFLWQSIREIL